MSFAKVFLAVLLGFIAMALQGCGCDTTASATCLTGLGLDALVCAKYTACYNDNGCCGEDGVKASPTLLEAKPWSSGNWLSQSQSQSQSR